MIRRRPSARRPLVEELERRQCPTTLPVFPGTPFELPQDGAWTQTSFIGSPIFADLNGDGRDELITPVAGGRLSAYTVAANGSIQLFRTYTTDSLTNFKFMLIVLTLPNGRTAPFAGLGHDENSTVIGGPLEDGRVFGWDAVTGNLLPGWPQSSGRGLPDPNTRGTDSGIAGPLASGDIDGDGVPEIVVTSASGYATAFRLDGSTLWRYLNNDTIESGAVIGDIDRDGRPEVVFGSDSSNNPFFQNGGFVNVLDSSGSSKYRYRVGETVWSSPVLVDLDGNGTLEIVVGTGATFAFNTPSDAVRAAGNQVTALDFQGRVVPGWPFRTTTNNALNRQPIASPAVADIDGDGRLDVVVDSGGSIFVLQANGQPLPAFAGGRTLLLPGIPRPGDLNFASPIVADADGDGRPEIISSFGGYLTVLDRNGQILCSFATPGAGPNNFGDGRGNAAAVGQFDGAGGLELASVSNIAAVPNRPHFVSIYRLPASPLAPPWPLHRRSAAGVAIARSPSFLSSYVVAGFRALLRREPSPADVAAFTARLQTNQLTPSQFSLLLAGSREARERTVRDLYLRYLNRAAGPAEVAFWAGELATRTVRAVATEFIAAPEFSQRAGGTPEGIVALMYRTILGREANSVEINAQAGRLRAGLPLRSLIDVFLLSEEYILGQAAPVIAGYATAFPGAALPADARAAILFDLHRNRREEEVYAAIVASGGNYAATHVVSSFIRSVYRDVLLREAGPAEVASWHRQFDAGTLTLDGFARILLNSGEGRGAVVRTLFLALLGRDADPGAVASLSGYAKRDDLIATIVSSPEYYNRNGGTVTSFVQAVHRDLVELEPTPPDVLNFWVGQINGGRPRTDLVTALVGSQTYFNTLAAGARNSGIIGDLFRYVPNEALGVLRNGYNGVVDTRLINPDPDLVNLYIGGRLAGVPIEEILATVLSSPRYIQKADYYKGLFRALAIRS